MIFPKAMKYHDVQERELNIQLLQVIVTRVHFPHFVGRLVHPAQHA